MKDTIIKAEVKKRELFYLTTSFVLAIILNIIAIIIYNTEWKELFTTFHVTLLLTIVLYILIGIIRLLVFGLISLFQRKKA